MHKSTKIQKETRNKYYGTAYGADVLPKKQTNWYIILMHPFHLIRNFMSRISEEAKHM